EMRQLDARSAGPLAGARAQARGNGAIAKLLVGTRGRLRLAYATCAHRPRFLLRVCAAAAEPPEHRRGLIGARPRAIARSIGVVHVAAHDVAVAVDRLPSRADLADADLGLRRLLRRVIRLLGDLSARRAPDQVA